jgi:hypothetical protein
MLGPCVVVLDFLHGDMYASTIHSAAMKELQLKEQNNDDILCIISHHFSFFLLDFAALFEYVQHI